MTSTALPNYLRANRKRLGLFQDDVAFLLGTTRAGVCRQERFVRTPTLEDALTYEAIYQKPANELFAGAYAKARNNLANRARALLEQMEAQGSRKGTAKKSLNELVSRLANDHENP